jgi:hypothetical protein
MRGCVTETEVIEFLDGRLDGDRVSALVEHVDACAPCRELVRFMARPTADGAHPSGSGQTLAVGELVAERHRIERFIAAGGMGEVYEAEDQMLGERVALKTVAVARSDDAGFADRLKREVQLARKVTHPNVCRIFDVGRHVRADGEAILFMTMELLAGETLGRRLRAGGPLSPRDARPLVAQVAAALDAAHDAGIIHRDLKSDNIFLVGGRAVVMDFGLAEAHATRERLEPEIAGTPHYMAPEQALGETVTGASDVYALGVVVYEMVTGQLPFPSGRTPFSVVARQLSYAPVPPHVYAPALPTRWTRTILRCLERDPARRFPRAGDVATALAPRSRLRLAGAAALGLALIAAVPLANRHDLELPVLSSVGWAIAEWRARNEQALGSAVSDAFRAYENNVHRCLGPDLKRDPNLPDAVDLLVVIDAAGKVTEIVARGAALAPDSEHCLVAELDELTFSPPGRSVLLVHSLRLPPTPPAAAAATGPTALAGTWRTNEGWLWIDELGGSVLRGRYRTPFSSGYLDGVEQNGVMRGTWRSIVNPRHGRFAIRLLPDGRSFQGTQGDGDRDDGWLWSGAWVPR